MTAFRNLVPVLRQPPQDPHPNDYFRAFRSVTILLSAIQNRPLAFDDTANLSRKVRYELKVLNALATIAVTDNDVVAVAAKHNAESVLNLIVMCTHHGIMPKPRSSELPDSAPRFLPDFLFSFNPRPKKSTLPSNDHPEIMETTRPTELQSDNTVDLENYLVEPQ